MMNNGSDRRWTTSTAPKKSLYEPLVAKLKEIEMLETL